MTQPRIPVPEAIALRFPFPTRLGEQSGAVTVATTAGVILKNNPRRVSWTIINLSPNRGFLWFNSSVGSSLGLPVDPGGGYWGLDWDHDGETVIQEVWAINLVASGTYVVVEVERV